ncbi:hypothetical protein [Sphingomonas sp. 35-24ZXX]|uniref:hypothetical protein n=1 Tax=Sphingomonas sp. 35-24ZXX TaxID=1545915 RepID=UPI00053BFD11|nr:hypothetical protein [Sphingomonas sp. 35-24ZXX]
MRPALKSLPPPDFAQDTIQDLLSDITQGIDARFVQVGNTLVQAVGSIDGIVAALHKATSSFQSGNGAAAVGNLTMAARRLSQVGPQTRNRASEIGAIQKASRRLSLHVEEVHRALRVLDIYGLNVKIAASGAETFVDFANTMSGQIKVGQVEVVGLKTKLDELGASLRSMEYHDRLLASECERVVPQVPDRLEADAAALRAHQALLAALADDTATLARSIQANVAGVLAAIQVGDIARQWLEHVLAGYESLQAMLAETELEEGDRNAARNHILQLLLAHVVAAGDQFRRETRLLVTSLRAMVPEADRLIALSKGSSDGDGNVFLRNLEAGIAEADSMITQLRKTDDQAAETLRIIVDTVDDLAGRAAAMRILRIEVQQMAINIGLRCRRVESISRPVAVIAEEIRAHSDALHETIAAITAEAEDLNAISLRMREQAKDHDAQGGGGLNQSLSAIADGAQLTEDAMAVSQTMASGLLGALRSTTDELERSLDLGDALEQIEALLKAEIGPAGMLADRPDHPVRTILEDMARSYTMASERVIHDQFLLPGMAPLIVANVGAPDSPGALDDDDALFDDALF